MTFPRARLAVSACLFLGWIGFLFYLVLESPRVILSWPQFQAASIYVVVEIREERGRPDPNVTVDEVLWSADPADRGLKGQSINLAELAAYDKQKKDALAEYRKQLGYQGAGKYLLPLRKLTVAGNITYEIAAVPRAPGGYPHLPTTLATLVVDKVEINDKELPALGASIAGLLGSPVGEGPALAATVIVAVRASDQKNVIRCLAEHKGCADEEAEALLMPALKGWNSPVVAARRLPEMPKMEAYHVKDASDLRKQLEEAGATVFLQGEEVKIYRALPETLAQVREIIASKR